MEIFQCGATIFVMFSSLKLATALLIPIHPHLQHIELIDITYTCNFYNTSPVKVPKQSILKLPNFMLNDFRSDLSRMVQWNNLKYNPYQNAQRSEVKSHGPEPSGYRSDCSPTFPVLKKKIKKFHNININITVRRCPPSSPPEEQCRCITLTGALKLINRFTSNWRNVQNNYQMTAGAAEESWRQSK